MSAERVTCGTCRLHASNFYGNSTNGYVGEDLANTCCADVEMDLPASWDNRMPMEPSKLRWCPIWRALSTGAPQ